MPNEDDRERPGEQAAEEILDYLDEQPHAYLTRTHRATVDFTIGDPDLWPDYHRDDDIRVIRSSSVSFRALIPSEAGVAKPKDPQLGSNIHFPPAEEDLWEELEEESEFSDKFALVNGSFELGGLLPPPDGICTPHLIVVEEAEISDVKDALDEAFRLYEEVYDEGSRVIKQKPEGVHE